MANLTLKNIAKVNPTKQTVAPGAIDELWVAPIADFSSIADLDAAVTDIDLLGKITTAHTFGGTKGFVKISDAKENTAQYMAEAQQGGAGNFKVSAKIKTNGFNTKMVGLTNQLLHQPSIGIVKLMNGTWMQIGSEKFPAYLKSDFDSKTNQSTEQVGFDLELSAVQPYQLIYDNTLALTIIT